MKMPIPILEVPSRAQNGTRLTFPDTAAAAGPGTRL